MTKTQNTMENLSPYVAFSHNTPAASNNCKVPKPVNGRATFLNNRVGGYKTGITMKCIKLFSIAILCMLLAVNNAHAQSTIRYQNNMHGGATLFGNSWFYTNSAATCFPTQFTADVDSDPYTYMSSSADLILPQGSTIVKAYLAIERGHFTPSSKPLTSVKLKVPGGGAYTTLTPTSPSFLTSRTVNWSGSYFYEQSIFDITSLMPASGYVSNAAGGLAGRYFLADPTTSTADSYFSMGGWSIILVYSNPVSKYRSLTVADNWQIFINNGQTVNTDVSGVTIPAAGTVNAVVGVTGTYGDRVNCSTGEIYTDYLRFGRTTGALTDLADPLSGATNNALNSSIAVAAQNNVSADGGPAMSGNVTTRNPVSVGHIYGPSESWDFDADIFNASGILPASPSPINVRLQQASNSGDVLVSGSYFISVDLAAPFLTKSLSPTTIYDGGTATYSFTVNNSNAASIAQSGISFTDVLPSGIRVAAVPNATITGGTGGVVTAVAGSQQISLSNLSLNAGTNATITVNVTNMPGQVNTSCGSNPAGFTNSQSNFSNVTKVNINTVTPQCLIVLPYTVTGNVFNDPDAGNVNNSTGVANVVPSGMYAVLVNNTTGLVAGSATVGTDGTYTVYAVTGNYRVRITTAAGVVGNAPAASALPAGWVRTGEYNGAANTGNTAPIDGISAVFAVSGNVSNINFGIQRIPLANNDAYLNNNTGTNVVVYVLANDTDYDGGSLAATTVNLVAPAGATGIVVDGNGDTTAITMPGQGTWEVNPTNGAITFTPLAGFTGNPAAIAYNVRDNAGAKSNNGAVQVTYISPECTNYFYQVGWWYNDVPATMNPTYFTGIVGAATPSFAGAGITGTVLTSLPSQSLQIPTSSINGTTLAAAIAANDYIGMSFTTAANIQPGNSIVGTKLWIEENNLTPNPVPDASQLMPYQFAMQISTDASFASGVFTLVQDQSVTYQGVRGFRDYVGNAYSLAPSTTYYLRYYLYNAQASYGRIIFDDQDPIFRTCGTPIKGTVYHDANGLYGTPANTVDGTPYLWGGQFVYATLVGPDNKVISNVPLSTADGTYQFTSGVYANNTYRVLLNTTQPAVGSVIAANAVGTLPPGWVSTGENIGTGPGSDGSPNSSLTIAVGTSPIYNANFGINCDVRAGNDGSVGICSNYQGVFSLEYVINGEQAGGVWTRLTGTGGTFNAAAGTFALTTNTTTSTFQYQVTNACGSDVSIATVVVNQIPVTTRSITICQGDQVCIFNPATTSRVIEPQTQICHNTTGTYYDTLRYAAAGGCDSVVITHLTVIPQPNAGDDGSISVCGNSTASIALADLITGEQAGGVWTRLSGTGGTFNATAGTFVPAAGVVTSTFQYLVTGAAPCGTDASIATVTFTTCTITISGSVHHDANGTTGGVDGPLISTPTATGGGTPEQLYAVLLTAAPGQPGSTVAQYAAVSSGSYSFSNVVVNTDYYVMLTTTAPTTTGTPAPTQTLPASWAHVSSTDASPTNGYTAIPGSGTDVSGVNFGIEQRPVANNVTWNVSGATENTAYKVGLASLDGDGNGEKKLNATDPEQGNITSGTKFQIVSVPKNAAGQTDPNFELRYNGNLITDGTIIGNFDPALLTITFKTASPPPVTSFLYKVADNAELFSTAPATYTINLLSILPVTGLQLKASAVSAGKNNIEWQTLTEANTSHFELERSAEGTRFEKIGTTQAAQNSNTLKTYSFTDGKAPSGMAYYRVRLVDQDGRAKLSNVAAVSAHTQQTVKLLPNPAKSFVVVTGLKNGQQVTVSGIAGGQVRQIAGSGPTRRIELAGYAAGTYILQVYENGKKVYTGRFIKQ